MRWGWDTKAQRWILKLLPRTQNKQQSTSSIYYCARNRRKNIPVSVKKQDTCISRVQKKKKTKKTKNPPGFFYNLHKTFKQIVSLCCLPIYCSLGLDIKIHINRWGVHCNVRTNFLFLLTGIKKLTNSSIVMSTPRLLPIKLRWLKSSSLNQGPPCMRSACTQKFSIVAGGRQVVDFFLYTLHGNF